MEQIDQHVGCLRRCFALAENGRGNVGNGALVGSVLVRKGKVIAEGWHEGFGKAHAERALLMALRDAPLCHAEERRAERGESRSATSGACPEPSRRAPQRDTAIYPTDILYVNLEPCCHHGKTPPCTAIILEKGIKNVVFGMYDPDPRVAGRGVEILKKAGVQVIGPVLPEECARFNRGFVCVRTKGRPWITLKQARMRDGRIANDDGSPLAITSAEQNQWSHQFLRARHDAIVVGIGTILKDDPQLSIRGVDHPPALKRIILDSQFRIPVDAKVVRGDLAKDTIIFAQPRSRSSAADAMKKNEMLSQRGVRIIEIPHTNDHSNWASLWQALLTPQDDYHGLTSILVEGGTKTWEAFKKSGYVDEEVILLGVQTPS